MSRTFSIVAAVLLSQAALADESVAAFEECRDEPTDAARLACYDRKMAEIPAATPAAEAPIAAAPVSENKAAVASTDTAVDAPADPVAAEAPAANPALTPEQAFGMNARVAAANDMVQDDAELNELGARISEIHEKRYGERVFVLDNGQVWVEKEYTRQLKLKAGDSVRIEEGFMGSHKLYGSGDRSTKVERVK